MRVLRSIAWLLAMLLPLQTQAYPDPHPFPPFRLADNLYYVGNDDLASYLVVTSQGLILINSDMVEDVAGIKQSIQQLGFNYHDIKILLISHAHFDHAAGSAQIRSETGASYQVMAGDVSVVESGGKTDFHYGRDAHMWFPATTVDRILHDGDQVALGNTVLTAHLTAGHTKGCTSWSFPVTDHGKIYQAVIVGSLNVNPGYHLVHNRRYPTITSDFEHAFAVLKVLPCDFYLGAHAAFFNLKKKYAKLSSAKTNPFVDPRGYQAYVTKKEQEFLAELHRQQQLPPVAQHKKPLP